MKKSAVFFGVACILAAPSASAEITEIINASWKEVPGTAPTATTDIQFSDPAYIDINSIIRNGNVVKFDVVNSDASYSQIEGNCETNEFRPLRFGYFKTQTTISYTEFEEPWMDVNEYQRLLLKFACTTY